MVFDHGASSQAPLQAKKQDVIEVRWKEYRLAPFQGACFASSLSGGVAALDHRLQAVIPSGSFRKLTDAHLGYATKSFRHFFGWELPVLSSIHS